jgi:hypothetical protein
LLASSTAASGTPLWVRLVVVPASVLAAAQGAHLLGFAGHEGIHVMPHRNKWVSTLLGAWGSTIDATLVGPLVATTRRAQYPEPTSPDVGHDPFARAVADEGSVPRLALEPGTASERPPEDDRRGVATPV